MSKTPPTEERLEFMDDRPVLLLGEDNSAVVLNPEPEYFDISIYYVNQIQPLLDNLLDDFKNDQITKTNINKRMRDALIHFFGSSPTNKNSEQQTQELLERAGPSSSRKTQSTPQTKFISKKFVFGTNLVCGNGNRKETEQQGSVPRPKISAADLIIVEKWFRSNLECSNTGLLGELFTDLYQDYCIFVKEQPKNKLSVTTFRRALLYIAHERMNYNFVTIKNTRPNIVSCVELKNREP